MAISTALRALLKIEISVALQSARTGKGVDPHFLTAYQILQKIPGPIRKALIDTQRTDTVGKGAGEYSTAASAIGKIAGRIQGVDCSAYIVTTGMWFRFGKTHVQAGNGVARIYRWVG